MSHFFSELKGLLLEGRDRKALDYIFRNLNHLQIQKNFAEVDNILGQVIVEEFPTVHLLGFLTITARASDKLLCREEFRKKVERYFLNIHSPEKTKKLLVGL